MNKPVFLFTILLTIFAATQTQPVDVNDAVVNINNLWKSTSIQALPLSMAPASQQNINYLISQPSFFAMPQPLWTKQLIYHNTPPYFIHFNKPRASLIQLNEEINNNAKKHKQNKVLKNKSKTTTLPEVSESDIIRDDFKNDEYLLETIQNINPEYMIEELVSISGKHSFNTVLPKKISSPAENLKASRISVMNQSSVDPEFSYFNEQAERGKPNNEVKVEAISRTSKSGTIPQIPFGTYFLPYFAQGQRDVTKRVALILEPHSKAVVGNGGTAVSTPISKAFLKRGVPTNIYFSPDSVAIAGVGGKAHAQADLELDLVNY